MSAFIVSSAHISALVSYAIDAGVYFYDFKRKDTGAIRPECAQEIGRCLMAANVKSVSTRYSGRIDRDEKSAAQRYVFERTPEAAHTPADIYKACECLDYQCCEFDGWYRSQAREILQAIQLRAAGAMAQPSTVWEIA